MENQTPRKRVLFFAEGGTLAHVARPFVLAQSLPTDSFEVVFARPPAFAWLSRDAAFRVVDLPCQPSHVFAAHLDAGSPLYDFETLVSYVETDLSLIRETEPDVILGDFRLSLAVSARLAGVPYATLCDVYWSPEVPLRPILPVTHLTRYLPTRMAEHVFGLIAGPIFRYHARPMERLRRRYGLPGKGYDLRVAYTDADLRVFANFPALFPEARTHAGAVFLGPVTWSPAMALPATFPADDKVIYVTMGSSGDTAVLTPLLTALSQLSQPVVLSTAGRPLPTYTQSDRIMVFDFLPGSEVAARSQLVICNGGSPTTSQALLAGVPVLGITSNMDQFLNMNAIVKAGCGVAIRADRARPAALLAAIRALIDHDQPYRQAAQALAQDPQLDCLQTRFANLIAQLASRRMTHDTSGIRS